MSEKVIYLFFIYSFLFTGTLNPFPLYLLKTPTALNSLSLPVLQVSCMVGSVSYPFRNVEESSKHRKTARSLSRWSTSYLGSSRFALNLTQSVVCPQTQFAFLLNCCDLASNLSCPNAVWKQIFLNFLLSKVSDLFYLHLSPFSACLRLLVASSWVESQGPELTLSSLFRFDSVAFFPTWTTPSPLFYFTLRNYHHLKPYYVCLFSFLSDISCLLSSACLTPWPIFL